MKRAALILALFGMATWALAQSSGQGSQQNPPAAGQATPAGQAAPAGQGQAAPGAAVPTGKRPPQAKTQPEFDAYKAAVAGADAATLEKAADDFATKFPDSELKILLYKNAMRMYQNTNNFDKTEAMGRKVLASDADDPEALVMVAEVIADRTRDSDLDKDQRFDEAMKMAQKATQTVDTDVSVPAGTPPDKLDAYKALLKSNAYSIIGTIEFKKNNFAAAETDLQKSVDAFPAQPDPVVILRLAIAMDRQQKYADALKVANRAMDLTKDNPQMSETVKNMARQERDRLQQLTGGTATPPAAQPQPPKQ